MVRPYYLNKYVKTFSGHAEMLKGGVIMDVTTPEQAKIAQDVIFHVRCCLTTIILGRSLCCNGT